MTSSNLEINGADNIQRYISSMLNRAQKQLLAGCEPFADEMLFTMLEGANYICLDLVKAKQGGDFTLTVPVLEALRWFTVTLDPLLHSSGGIIKAPSLESLKTMLERIVLICAAIDNVQYWKLVQEVHTLKPMESVITKGDRLVDPEKPEFYRTLDDIRSKFGPDLSWYRYFREQILSLRKEEERPLYGQALQEYYRLEASDFATLNVYFQAVAQNFSQKVASLQIPLPAFNRKEIGLSQGLPQAMNIVLGILQGAMPAERLPRFTPLELRKQVLADLQSEMRCTRGKAQKWLEALEYRPGKDVFCHPIIPLIENRQQTCALLPWLFHPVSLFREQWDGELFFMKRPRSHWAKAMGQWYGDGFRDYVAKILRTMGIDDLFTERLISKAEFGDELIPWLRQLPTPHREAFTPDIICQKGDMAMVVSCKAEDLYLDYWLRHNYLYMPASEIRRTTKKNIEAIREVSVWGQCLASQMSTRQRLGIKAKKILPILVTSRKEPLGSPIYRKYIAQTETFPEVPAVTVDELKQFVMSGFDVSFLPLPHSPQILTVGN